MSDESFECELCTDEVYIADDILELKDYRCACGYLCCNKCRIARGKSKRGYEHHHTACEAIEEYEQIIAKLKEHYERRIEYLEKIATMHDKLIEKIFKTGSSSTK